MKIDINICSKDRATEVFALLLSLREQTHKDFDIYLLDDGSNVPLMNFYFNNHIVERLKLEGHKVVVLRNEQPSGVAKARQQLLDHTLANSNSKLICRLDDDCVAETAYLEKLVKVINEGYDIASGVTPPFAAPKTVRRIEHVTPVVNCVVLEDGAIKYNGDDCGYSYDIPRILPAHHFRSSALMKREVCEKIKYEDNLTRSGFREEEFYSFRAIIAGYKIGVHTQACLWHLMTPSGGERSDTFAKDSELNERILNRKVKEWWLSHGDFIKHYNEKLGIPETAFLGKKHLTSLIMTRESA